MIRLRQALTLLGFALLLGGSVARPTQATLGQAALGEVALSQLADAITEMDIQRAQALIHKVRGSSSDLAFEKARLALYAADCDTAAAILGGLDKASSERVAMLANVAERCAGATAGSLVVEDRERGLWFRLQDDEDRALLPYLGEVMVKALEQLEKDLGTPLPKPVRVDLVRDLFSLSAVSGLPLEAAETTGTVAVARFGRVTMLSPRAAPEGYPWKDTMAHELSHLVVSRASRDMAPLWLQEGIAKHQETRWRSKEPFDELYQPDQIAVVARRTGRGVGLDRLGPSIAMLPSPEAASIAFAEVTSFIRYWVEQNGAQALELLFLDLKGLGPEGVNQALRSVSGYDLSGWNLRWQNELSQRFEGKDLPPLEELLAQGRLFDREVSQVVRLSDLLFEGGHGAISSERVAKAREAHPGDGFLRFREARGFADEGNESEALRALGEISELTSPHYGWFALKGAMAKGQDGAKAAEWFGLSRARHPLSEMGACEGSWQSRSQRYLRREVETPTAQPARDLCLAARKWEQSER